MTVPFAFPPAMHKWSNFSTSLSVFGIITVFFFFFFSYSERCVEVSDCGFNLHFTDGQWSWTSFHIYLPSVYHLQCNLCSCFFAHFLLEVFFVCWDLRFFFCILNTSPLSDMWCPTIFSQSIICLLVLFMGLPWSKKLKF